MAVGPSIGFCLIFNPAVVLKEEPGIGKSTVVG